MVTVRYKKLKDDRFSAYLDVYSNNGQDKGKRNYEFLKIYVSKDGIGIAIFINPP